MLKKRLNELSRIEILVGARKIEIISEDEALNVVGGCTTKSDCTNYVGDCGTFGCCDTYTRKPNSLEEA